MYIFTVDDGVPLWMSLQQQFLSQFVDFCDTVLLGGHVLLELVKLALQHLHMLQVVTELIGGDKCTLYKLYNTLVHVYLYI